MRLALQFLIGLSLLASSMASIAITGDPNAGKLKSVSCAVCHGVTGNSEINVAWPKLAGQHEKYLSKELLDFRLGKKDGRDNDVMTSIAKGLTDQDIADISAYYQSLPRTLGAAQAELVSQGQQLYRGGNTKTGIPTCSACHSPQGLGNGPAAFPLLSGQNMDYLVNQLKAFRSNTRSNDPNHMMRDIAAKMSDQEITAVSSYIAGLH